jgi:hypothetical protein
MMRSPSWRSGFWGIGLGVLLAACSRQESQAPAGASASTSVPKLLDVALAETWDRALGTQTLVSGRAEIIVAPVALEFDRLCEPREHCLCVGQQQLYLRGPRETDRRSLSFGDKEFRCNECNGECPYPLGPVEVEGVLDSTTFTLKKPPKYLDGRKAEPAIASELVRDRTAPPPAGSAPQK